MKINLCINAQHLRELTDSEEEFKFYDCKKVIEYFDIIFENKECNDEECNDELIEIDE